MKELWRRLEDYFAEHWPQKTLKLRPPAKTSEIEAAEAALGIRFPDDFRESLAVHDGQDDEPSILWLPGVAQLGSLESMVKCWKFDAGFYDPAAKRGVDKTGRVREILNHPKHIAFAGSPYWDYDRLAFDFAPTASGTAGQIIMRYDIYMRFVAETWRDLLTKTVEGLENGRIRMVQNGEWMSYWITPEYLSPRAKKPISLFKYFN